MSQIMVSSYGTTYSQFTDKYSGTCTIMEGKTPITTKYEAFKNQLQYIQHEVVILRTLYCYYTSIIWLHYVTLNICF